MHHGRRDVDLGGLRQAVPLVRQSGRDLGHDRRIAQDAAVIERGRHDATMPPPALAFAGQQPAAEPGLQQPPRDVRPDVIGGIVEEDVLDRLRLVDDEGPPPQQLSRDDVLLVGLGREGRNRAVPHGAQELPQAHALLRRPRRGENGGPGLVHHRHRRLLPFPIGSTEPPLRSAREPPFRRIVKTRSVVDRFASSRAERLF